MLRTSQTEDSTVYSSIYQSLLLRIQSLFHEDCSISSISWSLYSNYLLYASSKSWLLSLSTQISNIVQSMESLILRWFWLLYQSQNWPIRYQRMILWIIKEVCFLGRNKLIPYVVWHILIVLIVQGSDCLLKSQVL